MFLRLLRRVCKEYFIIKNSYQVKIDVVIESIAKLSINLEKNEIIG